jgi:hypothetical protein
MEDSLLEVSDPDGAPHAGLQVGTAVVAFHGTTIRNMQYGILGYDGAVIKIADLSENAPTGGPVEVVIENPGIASFWGVRLSGGSSLAIASPLGIAQPGQPWGSNTCGVLVTSASILGPGANLVIEASRGQGVFLQDNSHADLAGAKIFGSAHNGVVAVNHSTVAIGGDAAGIGGNVKADLFCDSTPLMTGLANVPGTLKIQCDNVVGGDYPQIP